MKPTYQYIIPVFLLLSSSCSLFTNKSDSGEEQPLARVFDQYLYHSEIATLVKPGTPSKDSTAIVDNYIDNWVRTHLVLRIAEDNLSDEKKDVERQIENYRQSLIIYLYEKELVRQKLDTLVSEAEIADYYQNARENFFELKTNIAQLSYLKLNKEAPKLDSVRYWLNSEDPIYHSKLEDYCHQYAINYYVNDSNWLLVSEITPEIPIPYNDLERILKRKRFEEFRDTAYIYMLKVKDFRVKESLAPLSYVRDDIKKIIINKRKLFFLKDLYEKVYDDALGKSYFEIY